MSQAIAQEESRVATAEEVAAFRAKLARARRMRHQARLIVDGEIQTAGPWRDDHLAAVCDRRRILDYIEEQRIDGRAEIASAST